MFEVNRKPRYLYYNLKMLKITTILLSGTEKTNYFLYRVFYYLRRFIFLTSVLYIIICSSIDLYIKSDSPLINKSATIVNLSMYTALIIRISYFWNVGLKTKNLVEKMFETFRYETFTGLPEEVHMGNYEKISNSAYLLWFSTAFLGGELYNVIDIFTSKEREMPMSTWHPYNVHKSPYYELTCLLQIFSQAVMVLVMNGTDTFWFFMAYITSGQFKLLAWDFENICYTTLIKIGVDREKVVNFKKSLSLSDEKSFSEIYDILQSETCEKVLNEELINLVKVQEKLLDFCKIMDDYWSGILLPMVLITQTYTTFSIFVLLLSEDATSIFRIWQYIIPMLLEIGFLTYAGQLLQNESEIIQLAIYKIPWYLCGKKIRNLVKMIHFRARKPVVITMANFAAVDLKAYTYLMKSSLSYLAVLNKMRNR